MTRTLLLDIDGVLVRDKPLLDHVKNNCVEYVRAKLPHCKDPHETNRLLYLAYGHTARGLHSTFKIDARDFNQKVYDKNLMSHLADVLATEEFQQEALEIHELTQEGWDVTLFTNAPWEWAHKVGLAIGDTVGIRCSGDPLESPLKPEVEAYMFATTKPSVVFVDDSLKNLGTVRDLKDWKCVHFVDKKDHHAWCPQVSSMWELGLFARSMDI